MLAYRTPIVGPLCLLCVGSAEALQLDYVCLFHRDSSTLCVRVFVIYFSGEREREERGGD